MTLLIFYQLGDYNKIHDIYIINNMQMTSVDNLRNGLIDKILSIKNVAFLEALDQLISSTDPESDTVVLTTEQKAMLELSEKDIRDGRLISQEAMEKRNLEWLDAM